MIFAKICRACGRELVDGEQMICLHCVSHMPLWSTSNEDLRASRFPRVLPVYGVWPWLAYTNDDPVCALIRKGKFDDRPDLIEELSRRYAMWLVRNQYLKDVDILVPVPMHWWKKLLRGYNQAELIARAVSEASGIPMAKAIRAKRRHSVQSRKSGVERAENVAGMFELYPDHGLDPDLRIAVIDDILTTGATLTEAMMILTDAAPRDFVVLPLAATKSQI